MRLERSNLSQRCAIVTVRGYVLFVIVVMEGGDLAVFVE